MVYHGDDRVGRRIDRMRDDCIYAIRKFDMKGIWKQPRMPIYLSKKIVVSPDV